jgi:hypothetical protein
MGAAKIAHEVLFSVASFLVSNDDGRLAVEHRQTTRHGTIVGKVAIAVQFNPVCKTSLDVIESKWPLRVPRDLDAFPRRQIAVNPATGFPKIRLQLFYCRIEINVVLVGMVSQIFQLPFEIKIGFSKSAVAIP